MKTLSHRNHNFFAAALLFALTLQLSACGQSKTQYNGESAPTFDGGNSSQDTGSNEPVDEVVSGPTRSITITSALEIRTLKNGVLDLVDKLPAQSTIAILEDAQVVNPPFRDANGNPTFSSTGFLQIQQIEKVPSSATKFTTAYLNQLHALPGGLYISAVVGQDPSGSVIPAVKPGAAGAGYLQYYSAEGKPKKAYTTSLAKKFGTNFNKAIPMAQLPGADQVKWTKIYEELTRIGNRLVDMPKSLLMISTAQGTQFSIDFEKTGFVSPEGAWTIAVEGTAKRHGFANVPCAEFMSQVVRQSYKRAGYSHFDDFTKARGNTLDYVNGAAAVVNLANYMNKAGWIPWDSAVYIPKPGAIMMHQSAQSPGHAYMSGGDSGRIIVDNGMPQGRDLRITKAETVGLMYQHGVFFLPPGFIPDKWK